MSVFHFRLSSGVGPVNIAEWRALARRRLPDLAWNYLDGGADDLVTLGENMAGFAAWRLRQRILTGIAAPDLSVKVAGTTMAMPLALAPVGVSGMAHWTGDIAGARAAEQSGTRAVLSTAASYLLEDVARATEHNHWFQVYPIGGRERIGELIGRARDAGYSALFVTVDVPTMGNREGERRWHFTLPWTVTPPRAWHMARHWRWVYDALVHKRLTARHFLEVAERIAASSAATRGVAEADSSRAAMVSQLQPDLTWEDVQWMRDQWQGPFFVKGILDPDDAAIAVDRIGADGVVVSNHGGRQLDRCLASIDALPSVVARVGDRAEVLLDGGVRRGTDVVTALALGAKAVLIGRPWLYGLAAAQEAGVRAVLEIFRDEIARNLTLMGCPAASALDRGWLMRAGEAG